MFRNKSVSVHAFSMVPAADVPRSAFKVESAHKTTFDAGYLVPVYVDEVLPGDSMSVNMTAFARLATPIFPIMDNMHLDSFFFFVPARLLWAKWQRMMGERPNPDDSIDFTVPQIVCPAGGYAVNTLYDYFGLPTVGQMGGAATMSHNALPIRAYNLIWNEWFRDENLQDAASFTDGDGPDTYSNYVLRRRGKRHDYFTSCLPFPQKGDSVPLPLGTTAPVMSDGGIARVHNGTNDGSFGSVNASTTINKAGGVNWTATTSLKYGTMADPSATGLVTDLSEATAATINQLRQSFQIQKLLERDARGGTRYTEIIQSHFRVKSPDARLQRPEYLGGGSSPIVVNPVAQSSGSGASGTTTPMGTLSAIGTMVAQRHGFTQSFTEHGYIIGMVSVRADLSYQQGVRKLWSRETRYDFYWPVFAALGEQAVLNREIYCDGSATDDDVFGYQERWAEYRYHPSMITGLFRSTAAGSIDNWHLSQDFGTLPLLDDTFIQDTPPVSRVVAVGAGANGKQFIFDSVFSGRKARPMPLYSVPGLIDHF